MASRSPAPNSSPSPVSPSTPSPPPPIASTRPPSTPPLSPPQPPSPPPQQSPPSNSSDPATPTPTPSPPGQSSPPPPSRQPSATSPPPASGTPPPLTPALSPSPPRTVPPTTPPPTPSNAPTPSTDPPSPSATPPVSSTPPAPSNPPPNSPPPPAAVPPRTPPPQSSNPPENSPPPSPPPPQANPPDNSPPQPTNPPENSPPTPPSAPPETSPPSPASIPPRNAPPPRRLTPPPPGDASPSSPPPKSSPPPPPSHVSPPLPSTTPTLPSGNGTDDGSGPNVGVNSNSNSNGGISAGGVIAIGVVAGIIALSIVGFVVWYIRKPRRRDSGRGGYIMPSSLGSSPKSESSRMMKVHSTSHQDRHATGSGSGSGVIYSPKELGGLGNSRSFFTYEELFKATNAFSTKNLLGEGGFGSVYKGYLPDGREVAVKELKIGGGQGEQEFKAEVEIIGRVHHRHLVSLVGYCISEHQRLLVYDYVPNNSLYYHLHLKGDGEPVLDWAKRIKIAAGAARGIAYLHEDCHPRIIHRDIKSSNILLDENFEARVSDFGLAKLALDAQTHITTRVVGTFGYVAPEYASSGKLTERSDVYSFGVVLLELITGRKAVDASQPMGDESLVEWARPLLNHALDSQDFERLVDSRLQRNYVESEMLRMIGIAAACVRHASAKRPQMGQVVRTFDSLATADLSNGMRFGESQAFDSAQQSAEIRFFRMLAFGNQDYSSDFYSQGSSNA